MASPQEKPASTAPSVSSTVSSAAAATAAPSSVAPASVVAASAAAAESLPFGPWKTLYSGVWVGHKSSLFANPNRVLLLLVHDDAPSQGALILLKKAFVVEGESRELVAFLNSQKRSFSVIDKIGRAGRVKFLLLDGEPTYAANVVRDFGNVLRSQYAALSGVSKSLLEVAESYKTRVADVANAPFETADLLLGDPLFLAAAKPDSRSSGAAGVEAARSASAKQAELAAERSALLGLNSNREAFAVDVNALRRVTILSKDAGQSAHLMQVLAEGVLLNGVSCLVFASGAALSGLGEAALARDDYDYFRMNGEPHGFPFKEFSLSTLKIDLSKIAADDFLSALGLQNADFADAVYAAFDAGRGQARDLVELMEALDEIDAALFPPAVRARAARVLHCLEREFPHAFGENKPALFEEALRAAKDKHFGGVLWLDASGAPQLLKQLHYCHAAAAAASVFGSRDAGGASVDFFMLCDDSASQVGEAARRALSRASEAGAGFCLSASYAADLSGLHSTLAFEIVGGDFFASLEGAKTKFSIRPTFSSGLDKKTRMAGKPGFFALGAKPTQPQPAVQLQSAQFAQPSPRPAAAPVVAQVKPRPASFFERLLPHASEAKPKEAVKPEAKKQEQEKPEEKEGDAGEEKGEQKEGRRDEKKGGEKKEGIVTKFFGKPRFGKPVPKPTK